MNKRDIAAGCRAAAKASMPIALAMALASMVGPAANAAEPAAAPVAKPAVIPFSQEIDLRSKAGLDYRIFVYVPATPPPPEGYPVIYVLDGNAWFEPMASAVRLQANKLVGISPAVVVGIAYPGDAPFNQLRRFYDFIPDMPLIEKVPPGYTPPKIGGADQFLNFISAELEPEIEGRVKIDRNRRTLFGHSLGCSMAFHVLFTSPKSFSDYVCASPTLGFNGGYILKSEKAFEQKLPGLKLDTRLVFAVAEYDEKVPPSVDPAMAKAIAANIAQARIVTGGRELYQRLAPLSAYGLKTTFIEIPGENHISEVPVLINRFLPIILKQDSGH
jgi:predicted alpha/beta superfamily hydrolase